ncbi:MAG: hypothetical protein R2939_07055 [Kofleriaceae bacterium]
MVASLLALGEVAQAQPEGSMVPPVEELPSTEPAAEPPVPIDDPVPTAAPVAPMPPPVAPPVVVVAVPTEPPPVAAPARAGGLRFGSYGRVHAGSDLRGGKPEPVGVVAYRPRVVEPSYLELDFGYDHVTPSGRALRTVATLAFDDTLFHASGEFDAQPALRNLFAEAELGAGATAWVGSRMYRGDDIYLLDTWPLDDQNTLGGGARVRRGRLDARAHVGWNRLANDFQFQEIDVADPAQGATTVTQLNRQRTVASATVGVGLLEGGPTALSARATAHAEVHHLPSGTRERDDGSPQALPSDTGVLVGAELSLWGLADSEAEAAHTTRHLNLFVRYARGLAAFDELRPPTSFDDELRTQRASELLLGAGGNWDHRLGTVTLGYLTRRFVDADRNTADLDDGWEHVVAVRPLARVPVGGAGPSPLSVGADLSYQVRFARGPSATTGLIADAAIAQVAPMVVWSPMGPSAFARPQLRLVYRAAYLNDAARDAYVPDDPRGAHAWVHYLGLQAEWWFNSSTYGP